MFNEKPSAKPGTKGWDSKGRVLGYDGAVAVVVGEEESLLSN